MSIYSTLMDNGQSYVYICIYICVYPNWLNMSDANFIFVKFKKKKNLIKNVCHICRHFLACLT